MSTFCSAQMSMHVATLMLGVGKKLCHQIELQMESPPMESQIDNKCSLSKQAVAKNLRN